MMMMNGAVELIVCSGVATGVRGCVPHRAALARGGKGAKNAENYKKNSRENSDCKFHVFACKKNKALRLACTYRQLLYVGSYVRLML